MLLSDDEIALFPDNPALAFVEVARLARDATEKRIANTFEMDGRVDALPFWSEYAATLQGAMDALELDYELNLVPPFDDSEFYAWRERLFSDVNRIETRVRLRAARDGKSEQDPALRFEAIDLGNYKDEIRNYTNKIRKILNQITISEQLREALFNRLNAFEREVDRNRTRWESVLGLLRITTKEAGEGAEELEPVVRMIERVTGVMEKAAQEQPKIEAAKRKLLKGPPKEDFSSDTLDDDIPF